MTIQHATGTTRRTAALLSAAALVGLLAAPVSAHPSQPNLETAERYIIELTNDQTGTDEQGEVQSGEQDEVRNDQSGTVEQGESGDSQSGD